MRLLVFPAGFETRLIAGAALLLSVLQIEVYPRSPGGAGLLCLAHMDGTLFCQPGFPGTSYDISVRLLAVDGPRRRHHGFWLALFAIKTTSR
jgi:hypothetical protein